MEDDNVIVYEVGDKTYKSVPSTNNCEGCAFSGDAECSAIAYCFDLIFVEVKDDL